MEEQKHQYRRALHGQPLERLTRAQIEGIHGASVKLLAETGIQCAGEQAAGLYRSAGCEVSENTATNQNQWNIRFPEKLLKKALSSVPAEVVLGARDPQNALYLNANIPAVYFGTGSEANIYLRSKIERFASITDSRNSCSIRFEEEPGSIAALCESAASSITWNMLIFLSEILISRMRE